MNILIYIQQENGTINGMSLEGIKAAQEIIKESGGALTAITMDSNISEQIKNYNLNDITYINNSELKSYSSLH